ncbi:MAG: hypothetical protein ACO305_17690 [Rubrivivax sp.]|jgi:hypothetical protein
MNATWGWALALAAVVLGWLQWGWRGVLVAVTVVVFWLLLQFSRAVRVMRLAAGAPVGQVASAVMLHARLRQGMRLMEILPLTRSLGQRVEPPHAPPQAGPESVERFAWCDASGARVQVELVHGRLRAWTLQREPQEPDPAGRPAPPDRPEDRSGGA